MNHFNENKIVGQLAEILALERGYSQKKAAQIHVAAALHDVGKQKIPKNILDKPDRLEEWEFEIIKTHTKLGAEVLSSLQGELKDMTKLICLFHHEWHNPVCGGYWGVSMQHLPDYVSYTAICDVFVSLISERAYKSSWSIKNALEYIQMQSDKQFCPKLVDLFVPLIQNDSRIAVIFTDI